MKYIVVSMRDKHTGFMAPQLDVNDQSAVRNFANTMQNAPAESIIGFAPADFDLYKLGTFDSEKGMFDTGIPEFLANGASVIGGKDYAREA